MSVSYTLYLETTAPRRRVAELAAVPDGTSAIEEREPEVFLGLEGPPVVWCYEVADY